MKFYEKNLLRLYKKTQKKFYEMNIKRFKLKTVRFVFDLAHFSCQIIRSLNKTVKQKLKSS